MRTPVVHLLNTRIRNTIEFKVEQRKKIGDGSLISNRNCVIVLVIEGGRA